MNTLYLVMVALTALPIVVGALLGLKRGLNRSILRLVIVAASVLAAWLLREKLTEIIINLDISGIVGSAEPQTIRTMVEGAFAAEQADMVKLVMPIVQILVGVIAFLLSFIVLKFVSLIGFWILKIVVRPGKRKNRLFGGLVGLAQGVLMAYFVCVPLNGLIATVNTISKIEIPASITAEAPAKSVVAGVAAKDGGSASGSGESASVENPLKELCEQLGIYEYLDSGISALYNGVSFGVYDALTTVKNEKGKDVTLNVQVDAIVAVVKVANAAQKLGEIDFSAEGGLTDDHVDKIKETFNEIENIKNEITPEARESLTEIIATAVNSFGGENTADFSKLDLDEVNFSKAGEAVEEANNLQKILKDENATEEDIKKQAESVIEKVADSKLVTVAADMGVDLSGLIEGEENKNSVKQTIDELKNDNKVDEETADAIKKILGLSESEDSPSDLGGEGLGG